MHKFFSIKLFLQKQPPEVFHRNSCSEKFCKIRKKTPVLESFSNKVACLNPLIANPIKWPKHSSNLSANCRRID